MILLHFLPKMRSKDLWQNESGTTESWKIVKKYIRKFLEVPVFYTMTANLELGNLNMRAYSDNQDNVFRPSVSVPLSARVVLGPLEGGKGRDVCLYVKCTRRTMAAAHSLPDTDKAAHSNIIV